MESEGPQIREDQEIAAIREQIAHLRKCRDFLATSLLSSQKTSTRLEDSRPNKGASRSRLDKARKTVEKQATQDTADVYRALGAVTAFQVQDPDPYALDGGRILGLQIEVFDDGHSTKPYYVLLNRSTPESGLLGIYKHTVPPAIPLVALAHKYLPTHPGSPNSSASRQDLAEFTRILRKELISYHLRLRAAAHLKVDASKTTENRGETHAEGGQKQSNIEDIVCENGGRNITITWETGLVASIRIKKDGGIDKTLVRGTNKRRRARQLERRIQGGNGRVEHLTERIQAVNSILDD